MFLDTCLLIFIGFASGIGVAAGTFAFFIVIKVIPRMLQKADLTHKVIFVENMVIRGILFGAIISLFTWKKKLIFLILGRALLAIFGISAGIFAGCIAVALAEILDTFPIFLRRLKMKESIAEPLIFMMAMGKTIGSLFYFLAGYGIIGR